MFINKLEQKTTAVIDDVETKHLDFDFEIKEINETDPDNFIFEGYASTFNNVDRGYDIVLPGAFTESIQKMMPKVLWQHDSHEPIGIVTEIREDAKGLYVKCKLPKSDSLVGGRIIPQVKVGSINTMSIGYSTDESIDEKVNDTWIRKLKKVTLWELSLVTIPMNPEAMVTDFKEKKEVVPFQNLPILEKDGEADTSKKWDKSGALKRIKTFTKSEDSPTASYKNAFLWYDKENKDNFGAYKLPIADIVDGKMVVIPKAVFASAAALSGARGGVDIPATDKKGVISNINKYYDKMDKPSPFKEKNFTTIIDIFENMKDVSEFLKDRGLSNKETNVLISVIKRISRNEITYRKEQEALKELHESLVNCKNKITGGN